MRHALQNSTQQAGEDMADIHTQSATALGRAMDEGQISAPEIMAAYLDRIERFNPKINAIVALRPRAELMAEAEAASRGPRKSWLHGLPFAIKDLQNTKGLRTTMGSPLFADHVPTEDDLLPARLRAAGAIIIGKTNTPELGLGSNTFNPVYGATLNPYNTAHTVGGSSGGAAAALAMRMLPIADGSDMMGSLRNPAAFCNVYGFRPSWGLVPSSPAGDVFLHQLSTDGPMGRSPSDIAALLDVLAGPDARQPNARSQAAPFAPLTPEAAPKRIGWLGDWGGAFTMAPGIIAQCEAGLAAFAALGHEVETVAPPFPADAIWDSWTTLRSYAIAAAQHAAYRDPAQRAQMKTALIWEIERGLGLGAMDIARASALAADWQRALVALMGRFDALTLPSAQVWPFEIGVEYPTEIAGVQMDTYHRWMQAVIPVSLLGLPALALPAGFGAKGLPMGFQLFGLRGDDQGLLALGAAYHQAVDWPNQMPPVE